MTIINIKDAKTLQYNISHKGKETKIEKLIKKKYGCLWNYLKFIELKVELED